MLNLNADAQQNLVVEVLYQREQIAALTAALADEQALADELAAIVSQSLGEMVLFDEYHPAASTALKRHRAARSSAPQEAPDAK